MRLEGLLTYNDGKTVFDYARENENTGANLRYFNPVIKAVEEKK